MTDERILHLARIYRKIGHFYAVNHGYFRWELNDFGGTHRPSFSEFLQHVERTDRRFLNGKA